ncbi:TlpA family protein disulfide reductase [Streptomyces sp. NPDC058953]|uniref:TlpA family protein disulfide reductase n=1 Tax=unclassified Streptomyces TaxID=2593676 RepID=UPI0036AB225F
MPYVITFLVLVGVLCLFNLVLCIGIIRRLREGSDGAGQELVPQVMRAPGERVTRFSAVTTAGASVSEQMLIGDPTLVAAFAQGCPECEEGLPLFAEYAATFPGAPRRVVAVLVGDPDAMRDKVAMLEPVAHVVLEGKDGPVGSALGVRGYPAFGVLDDHAVVQASGIRIEYVTGIPVGS